MRVPANPGLDLALFRSRSGTRDVFPYTAEQRSWHLLARGALWHGLEAQGLGEGDGVLVPAYNHGIEVDTLLQRGMPITFYGIGHDLTYDLGEIEAAIDERTRAIYVVHFFGFPQPLGPLRKLCDERGLRLIEDCALSMFSGTPDGPAGALGDMSIYSLHKTFGLHHGGILALNRPGTAAPTRLPAPPFDLSLHGLVRRASTNLDLRWPRVTAMGRRLRGMLHGNEDGEGESISLTGWEDFDPELVRYGAGVLVRNAAERADVASIVAIRRRNYEKLAAAVPPERLIVQQLDEGDCPLFFPVMAENKAGLVRFLQDEGIEAVPVWLEPHASIPVGAFPEAEYLRAHVVELPCHQDIDDEAVELMCSAMRRAFAASL